MTSPKPTRPAWSPSHGAVASDGDGSARPRILVVDDNADAANSLGRLLRLMGNETCVVHDGPTAIAMVAEFRPAVVLLDLGMPGMDGLETAEQLRLQPGGARGSVDCRNGLGTG